MEQFKNRLQFVVDAELKKINILKNGVLEKGIDWNGAEMQEDGNAFGIDCLNQIIYDIDEDGIKMHVGIGGLVNKTEPAIFFENEKGELYLDVLYTDGRYEIN